MPQVIFDSKEVLTQQDFEQKFEKVIEIVTQLLQKHEQAIQDLSQRHSANLQETQSTHGALLQELKGQVDDLFVSDRLSQLEQTHSERADSLKQEINSLIQKKLKEIDDRMSKVRDGKLGPKGNPGLSGSPDRPDQIVAKLNTQKGKVKIDVIDGLKDALQLLRQGVTSRGGAAAPRGRIHLYDFSGDLNGSTTTFNIPANWTVFGVWLSSSVSALRPTIDYTFTPSTITFTSQIDPATALASGQSAIVQYEEA